MQQKQAFKEKLSQCQPRYQGCIGGLSPNIHPEPPRVLSTVVIATFLPCAHSAPACTTRSACAGDFAQYAWHGGTSTRSSPQPCTQICPLCQDRMDGLQTKPDFVFLRGSGLLVETETLQARAPAPWKRRWVGSPDQAWARCGNTSEKLTGPLHWSAPKVQAGVDALNTRPRKTPGCKQQRRP